MIKLIINDHFTSFPIPFTSLPIATAPSAITNGFFFFFLRKLSLLFSCKRTYLPSPACTGLQFVGEFSSVLICQFSEVEGWCALQRLPSQPWQRGRGLEIKGDCGDCGNQRRQLERRAWKLKQFRNGASFTPTACTLKKCLTCNTV